MDKSSSLERWSKHCLTKLGNENHTNYNIEHLSTRLFSYTTVYKVVPYQLMYSFHQLMLTKYVLPSFNGGPSIMQTQYEH
jgi:hypothetical protein